MDSSHERVKNLFILIDQWGSVNDSVCLSEVHYRPGVNLGHIAGIPVLHPYCSTVVVRIYRANGQTTTGRLSDGQSFTLKKTK